MTTQARTLTRKDPGRYNDRAFWLVCLAAGVAVLAILVAILVSTVRQAWPAFSIDFFTSTTWVPNEVSGKTQVFGSLTFVYGTVVVSIIALVFAVPISLGIALFLTELAPRRVRGPIVTVI